jgi:hypothetical protein
MATSQGSIATLPPGEKEAVGKTSPWMTVVGSGGQYGPIPTPKVGETLSVHADWEKLVRAYDFYELSFRGGPEYKEGVDTAGEPILIRHEPLETDEAFKRRQRLAIYRNHCKNVIRRFNSFVFRKPVSRDGSNETFAEWCKNVDGQSTPLPKYMRETVKKAQICGRYLIGVETNRPPEAGDMTQAQALAAGIGMYLVRIDPRRMIDWRRESGRLTEALIVYGAGERATLWRRNEFVRITLDEQGEVTSAVAFPNEWGRDQGGWLPILEVAPFEDGTSQLADVAELNRHEFNLETLLGEELYGTTFTQYWLFGLKGDAIQNKSEGGPSRIICVPNPEADVKTTGGDPAQAESLRASMRDTKEDLFLTAGLKAQDPLQVSPAKSGVALKVEFDDADTIMSAIAAEAQRVESEIVRFYNQAHSAEIVPPEYPDNFGTPDATVELQRWQSVADDPNLPQTLKLLEGRRIVSVLQPSPSDDDKRAMEEELLEKFGPNAEPQELPRDDDVDPMEELLRRAKDEGEPDPDEADEE